LIRIGGPVCDVWKSITERELENFMKSKTKHSGLGIALGVALGTVFGVIAGNIGVWLAIGVVIGVALGASMRRRQPECPHCTALHEIQKVFFEDLTTELIANS
jgi:hypothetical protein